MKILIDSRMYGLENSGIGRYLINLLENLAELDKENDYVILLRKKYFDKLNFPLNWKKVDADFRHYTFKEQLSLPKIINKEKPDLVHFPHINFPIFWRGNYVMTVHDLTMQYQGSNATTLPLPFYILKRLPFLLSSKIGVKNARKLIVPSHKTKKDVPDYYSIDPNKIEVVYEGVTPLGGNLKLPVRYAVKEPYFIYVGNTYPHKNLEKAVESILMLNRAGKIKASLLIGGSRDLFKKQLQKQVKVLGASKHVRLLGYIPDEDLASLYKHSSGFIYPSFSEGFGLQGLEAMSAGALVLCSDIPVFREIYQDFAFYFDPYNTSSIAASMNFVLNLDDDKKHTFINKSQEFVKKYSWRKMANRTLEIYKEAYEQNL